ncbi:unnamed protein product [Phytophthora fragariaefolia]|uniref:Unnamed protein product n=1 Tax=Phytophthora fragariaefolia TaxID=1490495 RepID=A0A9W6Y0B5_9STRA|nr:unnamed protein product [Phytophthora fragariaefolia]
MFVTRIPNGDNVPGVKALGHEDTTGEESVRNVFGIAFEEGGSEWTKRGQSTTLHIIFVSDSVRLPLSSTTPVIKADVLNYARQTGAAVNTAAVTPTGLVEQQNKVITSCRRRHSGLPKEVTGPIQW